VLLALHYCGQSSMYEGAYRWRVDERLTRSCNTALEVITAAVVQQRQILGRTPAILGLALFRGSGGP